MPKRSEYNKQGDQIMRCATYHRGIRKLTEMADMTGIPYHRLWLRMTGDFGKTTADDLKALFRAAAMTESEIMEVWK